MNISKTTVVILGITGLMLSAAAQEEGQRFGPPGGGGGKPPTPPMESALVLLWLPESLDFLLARRPVTALQRINRLARRLGQPAMSQMPPVVASASGSRNALGALLGPAMRRTTLVIWLLFFLVMFGFYFVMSWTPRCWCLPDFPRNRGLPGAYC